MNWRAIQRENFTCIETLCSFLNLDPSQCEHLVRKPSFVLNLPRRLAHKIEKGRLDDPILRQFVPLLDEEKAVPNFVKNPVGDLEAKTTPRLLKKYKNRALLITSSACAMHCRYCFRRHFPYEVASLENEIRAIREDSKLNEVILSGGDPLSLSDQKLEEILDALNFPHIKRIRFHTRFPVGIPERIDNSFLQLLERIPQQVWFVVHINHPNEIDPILFEHLGEISRLGIPVLNQSVLLKGVNDSEDVLQRLFEELADHAILPYYLHQLDRVEGGAHFEVPHEEGLAIMQMLAKSLSGYSLPRYVQEVAGEAHKKLVAEIV
ncbi:MAG: KamA family radical SAM protein [Chlamydiales bacterium]|nr:KamA family radical SAM protein [Chlamydiales bacterium]